MDRAEMLGRMKDVKEWDVVIIGGGATGLGAAVDAATRGYQTLLIEQFDFGKGTSSRATKLVHGGVRYLAQGNIKLVMEALRERGWLLQNAPHLTSAIKFIIPAYNWFDKIYYGTGLKIYDVLSGKLSLGKTRILNKKETLESLPGLSDSELSGGIMYFDGQFDDARLAIALASTAAQHGGTIVNYCKANSLIKFNNQVRGIVAEDLINKNTYEIKAKAVINATGVFTDAVMKMDETDHKAIVAPSQGIHLVIDNKFFPGDNGLMIPKTDDGRVLFAVPWHSKVVLGTTDTPVPNISAEPKPLEEEIEFVLHHANKYFAHNISHGDVKSMFAGLRPLVKKKGGIKTSLLSRDHIIMVSKTNLISITGGKWTTYRRMAEDTIDNAAFVAKLPQRDCITKHLPINEIESGATKNNIDDFIHTEFSCTQDDIKRFVFNEMAMTVEDVLARRTRLLFLDAKTAISVAPAVAKIMAAFLKKEESWINEQVASFTELAKQYCLT